MFDREFITRLCSSVNLTELLRSYGVSVKEGTGKNNYYISDWCCGKSDYDNGRIDRIKQSYRCMSCMPLNDPTVKQKSKNAIHFLREHEGMSYREAVETLCKFVGMEMPHAAKGNVAYARKYKALELTVKFYEDHLSESNYLKDRGVSDSVMKKHRVGYAPGGSVLKDHLCAHGYTEQELLDYALINKNGKDRFYRRIVIPVIHKGKIVDLYGRTVSEYEKVKHFYLYGEFVCGGIDHIDSSKVVCIFESAIDRLVAESYGLTNGIDPGGAYKFGSSHVNMLRTKGVTQTVTLFDGDPAGIKGSLLAGDLLMAAGINNHVVELEEGKDVADILLDGGLEAITPYTQGATVFSRFKTFQLLKDMDVADIQAYLAATIQWSILHKSKPLLRKDF